MVTISPLKTTRKPVVGLYSIGLKAYWEQFPGLRERLLGYGRFIAERMGQWANVQNFGLVDTEYAAREAGERFSESGVDLVFCHCATYATSACVLPVHQMCKAPAVVLSLQPAARIDYARTSTGEWLAHCCACVAPEVSNAFNRAGIPFHVVSGLLGLHETPEISTADENTEGRPEAVRAWDEIEGWVRAASVAAALRRSRFGFLGNTYSGMLDMYSDFTMLQAQTGMHVQVLEMCDLNERLQRVSEAQVQEKLDEIHAFFEISGDSPADPLVTKPTGEQLLWSAKVAAAQEQMVRDFDLDALCYYYHSAEGNPYEALQGGFIVGHSLLTAKGVVCAGEGDLKTALAMKICDVLGIGGSFCEIALTDYIDGTILVGHDGPFHIKIAGKKPVLRGMGVYHGKKGTGVSVEAKVKAGPVTTLNVTQTVDGRLKLIVSEARATDGEIMSVGNTQTPVKFALAPDSYMERWFAEAPTHHFALAIGHHADLLQKVGTLLQIPTVVL
ncbi:MAG: L-fucose/L-arabinose isomerase family protein [Clostridiales bacterium]|nr:L-fucose/L-arabinose isomerase family protein [Clostridiales bacterium]